jgi:threonine dehydratase
MRRKATYATSGEGASNFVDVAKRTFSTVFSTNDVDDLEQEIDNYNQDVIAHYKKSSVEDKLPVDFEDVIRAYYRIQSGIIRTTCDHSPVLSELTGCNLFLKKDMNQVTGSFKERGARNALLSLTAEEKAAGVISASAGNHALAMAYHGRDLGVPVTVVMPKNAPITKVSKCKRYGATIIQHGEHIGEAREYAYEEHANLKYINGYNDPEIVAGAGSMGIEILEQVPDVDAIVCPVGGAGLIAGLSLATKTLRRNVEVHGVEPTNCASYKAALEAGYPVNAFIAGTLADGLAVPVVGDISFAVARRHVDETHNVSEMNIAIAILRLLENEKVISEGGGAAGLAALLPGGPLYGRFNGKNVVVPLCGGNIDTTTLGRVIDRGLAADSRLIRFGVTVSDRPGGVASITRAIADVGGSIKDIYHERAWTKTRMDEVMVRIVCECIDEDHAESIYTHLERKGYPLSKEKHLYKDETQ